MASQFQNRLVGTVILVALGVIILPGLLDGEKKHYEDKFAAIPLMPKPGDTRETDLIPPVTQPLPAQPPEDATVERELATNTLTNQVASQQQPALIVPSIETMPIQPVKPKPPETKPVDLKPKPVQPPKVEAKPEVKIAPKPVSNTAVNNTAINNTVVNNTAVNNTVVNNTAVNKTVAEEKAPVGQAYVVQLGALKNAAKVNEIIASLRLSGYPAYTLPSTPVQGEITRIYVGPDASKQRLQSSLPELNKISGLNGQVKAYSVR